jgi:hypothetical protein
MISEFYCDECKKYNIINLLSDLNGLHIIKCGFCNHNHYRLIKQGNMTDLRFNEKVLESHKLNAFTYKGKWRDKQWEKDQFMSSLWLQTIS